MFREKLIMAHVGDRIFIRVACNICNVDCFGIENEDGIYHCDECESRIETSVLVY